MYEHVDFAYFRADATAREAINSGHVGEYAITKDVIVFAGDSGSIYTQGKKFGGNTNITEGTGIDVLEEDGVYTISLDTAWLTENFRPTNTSKTYTAGDYIIIDSNNRISVNRNALNIPDNTLNGGVTTLAGLTDTNIVNPTTGQYLRYDSTTLKWYNTNGPLGSNSESTQGVTKEYVDEKINEQKQRLDDIINNDINWEELLSEYLDSTEDSGFDLSVKGIITEWVKNDSNRSLVWQQLNAATEKPSWVSVVTQLVGNDIQGTQINQKVQLLSALVGHFDENGNPKAEDFAGIIISGNVPDTENPGHTKSVIDLISDEIVANGTIVTPELISTTISSDGVTITGDNNSKIKLYSIDGQTLSNDSEYQGKWPLIQLIQNQTAVFTIGLPPGIFGTAGSNITGFKRNAIFTDGSGQLANGNIRWDANGNLYINGAIQVGTKNIQFVRAGINATVAFDVSDNSVVGNVTITNDNDFDVYVMVNWYADGLNANWSASDQSEALFVQKHSSKSWSSAVNVPTNTVGIDNSNSGVEVITAYTYVE